MESEDPTIQPNTDTTPETTSTIDQKEPQTQPKEKGFNFFSLVNSFFIMLTSIVTAGSIYLFSKLGSYWSKYKIPDNYVIPTINDLEILIALVPGVIIIRLIIETFLNKYVCMHIINKAKYADDMEAASKKNSQNIFKCLFFCFTLYLGYHALKEISFFPVELFGSGDLKNMLPQSYLEFLFFDKKSDLFDWYYFISLSYVLSDLIFLIFIHEVQTDFYIMFLHHLSTISLIGFSYLTNLSQIGVIVLFLHDATDILVYIVRAIIPSHFPDFSKFLGAIFMVLGFIYFRFFVFIKLLLYLYFYIDDWSCDFLKILVTFLWFLITMHIYWICAIISRVIKYAFTSKVEDIGADRKKKK